MNIIDCPECGERVVACNNNVYLDYPAVEFDDVKAPWTIMRINAISMASVGAPGMNNLGHTLHAHQPAEGIMQ